MIPWQQIDTAGVPDANVELRLMRRGAEFSMMLGQNELMNSRLSGSEAALATLALGSRELALKLGGVPRAERRPEAERLLESVHLRGQHDARVHELSGGMRQRVALARALAQRARILLMDEPFAALDAITRDVLHDELVRVWEENGLAVVFVTHNVREAVRLGQRVELVESARLATPSGRARDETALECTDDRISIRKADGGLVARTNLAPKLEDS